MTKRATSFIWAIVTFGGFLTPAQSGTGGTAASGQLADPISFLERHACRVDSASLEAAKLAGYDVELIRQLARDAIVEGVATRTDNGAVLLGDVICKNRP